MSDVPAVHDLSASGRVDTDAAVSRVLAAEGGRRLLMSPPGPAPAATAARGAGLPASPASAHGGRGAAIGSAYGAGSGLLARIVALALGGVALVIALGILLALLRANAANGVVSEVHGWGSWLVGPFNGMFDFSSARVAIAVNWGIAAGIYLFAGTLIVRLISRSHNWRPLARRSPNPHKEAS